MADESSNAPHPFDVQTIKSLVSLMSRHDLSEIDLRDGEARICLRRGSKVTSVPVAATTPVVAAGPAAPAAPTESAPPAKAETAPQKELLSIKAPTPGTYYAQSKPGADPYVKVGMRVSPSTVVGLIEAMKIYNEISADCSGVIVEILVEDGQPVEFDTVLFKVDPTG